MATGAISRGTGVRPDAFGVVVDRFFEAAVVPELWPAALHELSLACGGEGAVMNSIDGLATFGSVFSQGAAALCGGFVARWRAPDLNSHRARGMELVRRGWRGFLTEQDCFAPEELARDQFQQDFIVPAGFVSFAGAVLARMPGRMLTTSIYRNPARGPYLRSEVALMNKLADQLRAAGEVALRIGMESTRHMADAFGAAGHPIALIARDGRVLHMNAPFERRIGEGLCVKSGRLGSWQPEADRALAAAIARAVEEDAAAREPIAPVVLPRRGGARPMLAQLVPVVGRAQDILRLVAAIVTLTDLEAPDCGPAEAMLAQAFGLTPAEARLAAQIAAGRTLSEISEAEGSARETLRSRLKAVFAKTGTGRQAELALLLAKFSRPTP